MNSVNRFLSIIVKNNKLALIGYCLLNNSKDHKIDKFAYFI